MKNIIKIFINILTLFRIEFNIKLYGYDNESFSSLTSSNEHTERARTEENSLSIDDSWAEKYILSENIETESKFTIALYDFRGQDVFNVMHPLFMTRFGVYSVVINMTDLSSDDEEDDSYRCLSKLKFWLDSIAMHTLREIL